MANIQEYVNKQNIQPSSRPAELAAQTAMGAARLGAELGESIGGAIAAAGKPAQALYVRQVVQPEISQGGAVGAGLVNSLTQEWNNLAKNSDPNDGSIADTFTQKVMEPAFQKFMDGFKTSEGKAWAQSQIDRYRNHFLTTTLSDTASRAGVAASMNLRDTTNYATNAAYNDPTAIDFNLENLREAWKAAKTNLGVDAVTGAKFDAEMGTKEKEVILAGLKGFADRDPTQFKADIAAGKYSKYDKWLDADAKLMLGKYADVGENLEASKAAAAETKQARLDRENVDKAVNALYTNFTTTSPNGGYHVDPEAYDVAKEIAQMRGAESGLFPSINNALKAIEADERARISRTSDPSIRADFLSRAYLPVGNPGKLSYLEVSSMRAQNLLSTQDYALFNSIIGKNDPKATAAFKDFEAWTEKYKGFVLKSTGIMGGGDPQQAQKWAEFQQNKWTEYQANLGAGMSPTKAKEALDTSTFQDLSRYQVGFSQTLQNLTSSAKGTPPSPLPPTIPPPTATVTRNPGETPADFLARAKATTPAAKPVVKGDLGVPLPQSVPEGPGKEAMENGLYEFFLAKDTTLTESEKVGMVRAFKASSPGDRATLINLIAQKNGQIK